MDETLAAKLKSSADELKQEAEKWTAEIKLTVDDDETITLMCNGGEEKYPLKPLSELYGAGLGPAVNPHDDAYLPLLLCIEESIVLFDQRRQRLSDAAVSLALQDLSQDPERPSTEPLVRSIQKSLRINLSLNDYSRQEVRQAIRKVAKSVQRHNSGSRGYLEFVSEYVHKY